MYKYNFIRWIVKINGEKMTFKQIELFILLEGKLKNMSI